MLDTVAPVNRARGSGAIGSVTVGVMDVSESADSSTDQERTTVGTHRRRTAPNDGRSATPDVPFISRRRLNVDFGGLSPGASLPPSASRLGSVNVERMEKRYHAIAESLSHLGRQHRIRPVNVINNDIIEAYEKVSELENIESTPVNLLEAYRLKIKDLQREREIAVSFDEHIYKDLTANGQP